MAPKPSLLPLADAIPHIFDQAQVSVANHRKNCVALHKLHIAATLERRHVGGGEEHFFNIFVDMVSRVLVVKGLTAVDRIVRFVASYTKYLIEKVSTSNSDEDDSPAARFVSRLLTWLLQGFYTREKIVRSRSVSLVAELVAHVGELDEDIYTALRQGLMERAYDKESCIRVPAIIALSRLLGSEDPNDLPNDEPSILEALLDRLCYDPAAEVRRAALLHTPLIPRTLPDLLTRTRDVDPVIRKLMFSIILNPTTAMGKAKKKASAAPMAGLHPRQLTLSQREQVVHDGLGDRVDAVRVAAGRMIGEWYDVVCMGAKDVTVVLGLVEFLTLFDMVGSADTGIAADALRSLFVTNVKLLRAVEFDDMYWSMLTPESALLARVFVVHCLDHEEQARLEHAGLPVVTTLAFHLQEACNTLFDTIEELEEARVLADSLSADEAEERMERLVDMVASASFVVVELLRLVVRCDFTDEIGRRKVFAVVREMVAHELLPECLTEPSMDVLKATATGERELIRIVVEIITELRDDGDVAEQTANGSLSVDITQSLVRNRPLRRAKEYHDMTPEQRMKADVVDMRCLGLCMAMLSRVDGSFDENSTLEGVLSDLIVPTMKRKELRLRERGLVSLGLCCLIAKNMAMSSFQLFLNQVQDAPEALKIKVLQIIFDLLMVYDEELLCHSEDITARIITFLLQTLEAEESDAVQAVLCVGISKLMLSGLVFDERVLTSLILAYISPMTAYNQELRQCLEYFLPAYCYSSPANQKMMQSLAIVIYDLVHRVREELEEGEVVTAHQFGLLLIDWTNPQKAVTIDPFDTSAEDIHVELAIDILKALHDPDRSGDDRKVFCQLLGELYFPSKPDSLMLFMLNTLLASLQDRDLFGKDPVSQKTLTRFQSRFMKRFSKQVRGVDKQLVTNDERVRKLFEFLGRELEQDGGRFGEVPNDDKQEVCEQDIETPLSGLKHRVLSASAIDERMEESLLSYLGAGELVASISAAPTLQRPFTEAQTSGRMISLGKKRQTLRSTNEDKENVNPITTPKRPRPPKRLSSPGYALPSPAHKKSNCQRSPQLAIEPVTRD